MDVLDVLFLGYWMPHLTCVTQIYLGSATIIMFMQLNSTSTHMHMVSLQDGPSDLPEFERLTGVSESDLLHPHWTAVLSVPKHSTVQQIEASVIKLIEVHVGIYV